MKYRPADPSSAADALAALAALVRAGAALRSAVVSWPASVPEGSRKLVSRYAGAVAAGASVADLGRIPAVDEQDGVVRRALTAAASADRLGAGPVSASLEGHVRELRSVARARAEADAGTSGARLSGRLVAGLPVAFLLLVPAATGAWRDPAAALMIALGCALIALGARWLSKLMPSPPARSPAPEVARAVASLMATGTISTTALTLVAQRHEWTPLRRAAAATRLGIGWIDALDGVGDDRCRTLARILAAGRRPGYDTVRELERFAEEVTAASRLEFEQALRRAPVWMVLPLTLCLLPGFALITLGPFLRRLLA